MRHLRFLALILTFFISSATRAETIFLGAGVLFQNFHKTTSSSDSSTSLFGQVYVPEVSLAARVNFFSILKIMPTLGYTVISKVESDSIQKHILTLGFPLIFNSGSIDFKLGPGLMMYSLSSDGAVETLNNGTSTAQFYHPNGSHTSRMIYLDIGAGLELPQSLRLDLDLLVTGALSSRRAIDAVVKISKGIF